MSHKHMASMICVDFESKDLNYISYPEDNHITHTKSNGLRATVSINIDSIDIFQFNCI